MGGAYTRQIEINSVDDLFYYFDEMKNGNITEEALSVSIDSFLDNFSIILRYKDNMNRLSGSIDDQLAQAIIDFQEFIFNTYKVLRYQDSPVTLSDDEKASLKIYVKISRGSTIEEVLGLKEAIVRMVDGMDGEQKLIAFGIVFAALTLGYLGSKIKDLLSEISNNSKDVRLSEQETTRIEKIISGYNTIAQKIDERPLLKDLVKEGQKAILKPIKNNNSYKLGISDNLDNENTLFSNEIIIDNTKAKKILKGTRGVAETDIVTDYFNIKSIEVLDNGKYKIKITSSSADTYGIVEFDINDENIDYEVIFNNIASREPIKLTVKTKTINHITSIEKLIATTN